MRVRGFAKKVSLGETLTGLDLYDSLQLRVQNLRASGAAGRLVLQKFLSVDELSDDTFNLLPLNTEGLPYYSANEQGVIFGVHSPYRRMHLLVMPDLVGQPGVASKRGYQGVTCYQSAQQKDFFDVNIGFDSHTGYDSVALGIAEDSLPACSWRQDHDPNISVTNEAVLVWQSALEFPEDN